MTTATDLLQHAVDDLLLISNADRRRWMLRGYSDFKEYMAEHCEVWLESSGESKIGPVLNALCKTWIQCCEDGATYFENWQNDRRNAA